MPKATDRKWLATRAKTISGFCNNINKPAQCEGTRPKSGNTPLPVCHLWDTCPCECHKIVDEMFQMTGMDRQFMPNPDYVIKKDHFVMPQPVDPVTGTVAFVSTGVTGPSDTQHVVEPTVAPVRTPLVQRRTPLGYAGRGTLEAQVWECVSAIGGNPETKTVSEWIATKYSIPTPSRGAIQAVWIRWEKLGFASWAKKPVRFIGFENEGSWAELERIKSSVKQQKKSAQSNLKRGIRPPA